MALNDVLVYLLPAEFLLLCVLAGVAGYYRRNDRRLLLVLPIANLIVCGITLIAGWPWLPVCITEFPVGFLFVGAMWRYDHPLFWCGVLGTLWWYSLGRLFFGILWAEAR